MIKNLRKKLIEEARKYIKNDDPSHDINHALRVLVNSEFISKSEGGDLKIIIPAALFHDSITYQKNDPRSKNAANESAELARKILSKFNEYDEEKIKNVERAITEHSYGNGIRPVIIESKIIQDADRLEATGAIAIMRTFCSTGQMKRRFYNTEDSFCENRDPESLSYALDLFYNRLLKVEELMNTETAKKLAKNRTLFLHNFLDQFREEIFLNN